MPGKYPTIKSLKIGDVLSFGAYSAIGCGDDPVPITWIKASTNCDFITQFAVDMLSFDAMEYWGEDFRPDGVLESSCVTRGGNPNYRQSNIFQFLNSTGDAAQWFVKTHPHDASPDRTPYSSRGYANHAGFLRYFSPVELGAMVVRTVQCGANDSATGLVHLMSSDDVYSGNKLPLFRKRRGIRAKPTQDLCLSSRCQYSAGQYVPLFLRTQCGSGVFCVGADSYRYTYPPDSYCGIRPIIRLNPDAKIDLGVDDKWEVVKKYQRRFSGSSYAPDDVLSSLGLV